jgi:hypothetical protein
MGNSDGRQAGREAHHVDVASGRRSADTAGLRDLLRASFVHRSRPTARPPRDRLSASGHIYHPRLARIRDVLLSGLHDPCYGRGGGNVVCCLVGEPAALVRGSQHVARQKRPDPDSRSRGSGYWLLGRVSRLTSVTHSMCRRPRTGLGWPPCFFWRSPAESSPFSNRSHACIGPANTRCTQYPDHDE